MARYADVGPAMQLLQALPCSSLEFHFSCQNLKDKDLMSKSDPVVLMYTKRPPSTTWQFIGSTEKVMNNLNPHFAKALHVDYFFEEVTQVRFSVIDVDSEVNGQFRGDDLGFVETTVAEIVTARPNFTRKLVGASPKSMLTVVVEQVANVGGFVNLQLHGKKLANKDGWFGKSDPFFLLQKGREDGTFVTVHKSDIVDNNLNPQWKPFQIKLQLLCNGDYNRPIRIQVFDYDRDDSFDTIGHVDTTLSAMLQQPGWTGALKDPKGKGKDVGSIVAATAQVVQMPTLFNYLQGGLEIGLYVAIDFTGSNGDPRDQRSLHFNSPDPNHQNPYEMAVRAAADVLLPYDRDGMVPAYGYGAELPPNGLVSHCFALNGRPDAPSVPGVEGILAVYNQALRTVRLSGPTCFAPVINAVAQAAARTQAELRYSVLLIVTDGAIMDMDYTIDAIVRVSALPLSIIIVGVGPGPFGSMEQLDADNGALRSRAGTAKRDIVQFVKMSDYAGLGSGARLAKDVLHEMPDQVVQYFMSNGKPPPAPLQQAPR